MPPLLTKLPFFNRLSRPAQLAAILSQARTIIEQSPVKTGADHPIFSFIAAIIRKSFYQDIFTLNAAVDAFCEYGRLEEELMCHSKDFSSDEYEIEPPLEISLAHDPARSFPWNSQRMTSALDKIGSDVGAPWKHDDRNHFAYLLFPLGLTVIHNGNHSSACGIIKGEGYINVATINDNTKNYSSFFFDGKYVRRTADKSIVLKAIRFEYGVLFEVGRLILEHGIDFTAGKSIVRKVDIPAPGDKTWKIYPRNGRNILHYYTNCAEGECEVDVFGSTIVFTTTQDSFGTSTTNAIEKLASWVAHEYGIPLDSIVCYERYLNIDMSLEQRITFEVVGGKLEHAGFIQTPIPNEFARV